MNHISHGSSLRRLSIYPLCTTAQVKFEDNEEEIKKNQKDARNNSQTEENSTPT